MTTAHIERLRNEWLVLQQMAELGIMNKWQRERFEELRCIKETLKNEIAWLITP